VELFFVMLAAGMIGAAFLLVLNLTSTFLIGSLAGAWSWGWWMDLVLFPLSLWTVAFWATILRFLVYMNTRIRGEGWELELKLKAEARRVQDAEERKSA
jgi:membrane protein implicated in regulation of membrane protease activity